MSITITIFATLLAILVACNALITQAIKVAFDKREKKYSSNLIDKVFQLIEQIKNMKF